jgi:hypothetical protein
VEQSHSIVALTLVVLGGSGRVYFYFIDLAPLDCNRGEALAYV